MRAVGLRRGPRCSSLPGRPRVGPGAWREAAAGRVGRGGWGAHRRKFGRLTDGRPPTADWAPRFRPLRGGCCGRRADRTSQLGPLADPSPPGLAATC